MFDCLLMTATGVCDVSLTLTARYELDTQPPVNDHGAVMIDVKKRHLIILLSQDKKHLQQQQRMTSYYVPSCTRTRAATDPADPDPDPDLLTTRIQNLRSGSVKKICFLNLVQHFGHLKFDSKFLTKF